MKISKEGIEKLGLIVSIVSLIVSILADWESISNNLDRFGEGFWSLIISFAQVVFLDGILNLITRLVGGLFGAVCFYSFGLIVQLVFVKKLGLNDDKDFIVFTFATIGAFIGAYSQTLYNCYFFLFLFLAYVFIVSYEQLEEHFEKNENIEDY